MSTGGGGTVDLSLSHSSNECTLPNLIAPDISLVIRKRTQSYLSGRFCSESTHLSLRGYGLACPEKYGGLARNINCDVPIGQNAWATGSQEPCNTGVVEDPPATATMS